MPCWVDKRASYYYGVAGMIPYERAQDGTGTRRDDRAAAKANRIVQCGVAEGKLCWQPGSRRMNWP